MTSFEKAKALQITVLVLSGAALATVVIGCHTEKTETAKTPAPIVYSTGGGGEVGAQTQGAGAGAPITDLSTLTTGANASAMTGRAINLSNAKVQQVINDRWVTLSAPGGRPIYVQLSEPMPNLKEGDTVNLTGTVQQTPSTLTSLGLPEQATQALQGQPVYIQAQRITKAS